MDLSDSSDNIVGCMYVEAYLHVSIDPTGHFRIVFGSCLHLLLFSILKVRVRGNLIIKNLIIVYNIKS
jgi:hypothetical protein